MFPAATITGSWQPGVSTGDVLRTMEALSAQELPRSMAYEWTELSYLQKQASKIEQFRDLRQNPFSAFVLGAVVLPFGFAMQRALPETLATAVTQSAPRESVRDHVRTALLGIAMLGSSTIAVFQPKGPHLFDHWRWGIMDKAAPKAVKEAMVRCLHVWPIGVADADDGKRIVFSAASDDCSDGSASMITRYWLDCV